MLITDITPNSDLTEKQIWGRRGKTLVRKYKCSSGNRKGRIVAKIAQCFAAPNIKKKISMKRTRARLGARMARKAKRTKRINPASIALTRLNKRSR
jgi:hypothetical protein|tara:strand:+ start:442 stop:729 length:288 start_codon:yes stop_codon:yes gene_type:complete